MNTINIRFILCLSFFTLLVSANVHSDICVPSKFIHWKAVNSPSAAGHSAVDNMISEIPNKIENLKNWLAHSETFGQILTQEREMNITEMMGAMEYKWPEKVGFPGLNKKFDVEIAVKQMSFKSAFDMNALMNNNVLTTYGNTTIGFSMEFQTFNITNMEIDLLITEAESRLQKTPLGRVVKCTSRFRMWKNCRTRRISLKTAVTIHNLKVNGKIDIGIFKCSADVKDSSLSCAVSDGWEFIKSKFLHDEHSQMTVKQLVEKTVLKRIGKLDLMDLDVEYDHVKDLNVGALQLQKADLQNVLNLPPSVEIPQEALDFSNKFTRKVMSSQFVKKELTKRIGFVSKGIVNKEIQKYRPQFGRSCMKL